MSEEARKEPIRRDGHYFESHWRTIQKRAKEVGITKVELKEITDLVNSVPERRISVEKAIKVTDRAGLTLQKKHYFGSLAQMRREIAEAMEEGELSPDEAKEWNKKFGFSKEKHEE